MNFIQRLFKKKEQQPTQYFRVFDLVLEKYFPIGYNSTSEKELVKAFTKYLNAIKESRYKLHFDTWEEIAEYMTGVRLESSVLPFKDL